MIELIFLSCRPNVYISLDPSVSYEGHYVIPGNSNTSFFGSVDVMSSSLGVTPVCLQTMKRRLLCFALLLSLVNLIFNLIFRGS